MYFIDSREALRETSVSNNPVTVVASMPAFERQRKKKREHIEKMDPLLLLLLLFIYIYIYIHIVTFFSLFLSSSS